MFELVERSRTIERTAIIDGKEVNYTACADNRNPKSYDNLTFIGRGFIYKINGTNQNSTQERYFWK